MGYARTRTALLFAAVFSLGPVAAVPAQAAGEKVTIYRDAFGAPHIYGDSGEALFYAGGYALMQDRMAEFERSRRMALGRMSEVDPSFVERDKQERRASLTQAETRTMFEALAPEYKRLMTAQLAGINRAIDEAIADPQNKMPYEFGRIWQVQPERWSMHDYISVYARHRQWAISDSAELQNMDLYAWLVGKYGESEARLIFDDLLPFDDPDAIPLNPFKGPPASSLSGEVNPPVRAAAEEPAPRAFAQNDYLGLEASGAARPVQMAMSAPLRPVPSESRSVLIGPQRSASGNVLMLQATSDGPHVRYVGGGFDAYGYTRQGAGPLVMGRGPRHGWLQNVGMDDQVDVFAEKLNPENRYQYWYKGQWRDMQRRTEVIKVRGKPDVEYEIASTVHGPIVRWDVAGGRAYSEKNAVRTTELGDWVCNLEWMRAKTLAEFEKSLPGCTGSATINYGGEDGTIANWHVGIRPIRAEGLDPRLPTPGTGEYEWRGETPFAKWSKFKNPPENFFHAWNTRPSTAVTYRDNARWGATSRNYRAYDLVRPLQKVTLKDFHEVNRKLGNGWGGADASIVSAKFFAADLRRAVAGDPRLEQAVELMAGWNATLEDLDKDGRYDSPATPLMIRWLKVAKAEILDDDLGEWASRAAGGYQTAVLHRAIQGQAAGLPVKHDWFNGQGRDAVLRRTVARTVDELTKEFGTADMTAWRMPIYWRYYDQAQFGKHPEQPSRRPGAHRDAFVVASGTTAASLGLTPYAIPDNGSEQWNGMMEISRTGGVVMDVSPMGGQNQFINLEGKATKHIGDQLMRHANFDLKTVPMSLAAVRREAESEVTLDVPKFD
ncbi:penicillin acylase family protein [Phenylobacterium sp.]|uniref:penicillin acylase family protein n=1 Tax=Phenylobacterium sp. TaxID=1871053 RepID=UPI0037834897